MVTGLVQKSTRKEVAKRLPQVVVKFSPELLFHRVEVPIGDRFSEGTKSLHVGNTCVFLLFTLFL